MKLVDILARELEEWPEHASGITQSAIDGELYLHGAEDISSGLFFAASHDGANVVTRAQWQEARKALSKPANSEQPNWDEALEGFDYFIRWPSEHMENHFYQLFGDRYVRDNGHYALVSDVARNPEIIVMKRPVAVEKPWNGEGLPPANTMVEMRNVSAKTEWAIAKIVFASRNVVVWDWGAEPAMNGLCTAYAHAVEIRPIRTPEQIAAEGRSEFSYVMCKDAGHDSPTRGQLAMAEKLFDAGYRKVNDGNQKA